MQRRPLLLMIALALALGVGLSILLAGDRIAEGVFDFASDPPWQEQPTRVSTQLTPFADIPGFTQPTPIPTKAP